uniref:Uncharacterized protein n=1 Tax=viral metagenome TaxID=1070528 RepID=A0A6C0JPA0_9ZZZZ
MSKLVDLLDEDKPIAEQKFVCLSFVSPEYEIKNKKLFFFEEFVKEYDFLKSMEKFTQFINFISYKYNIKSDDVHEQFKTFVESERTTLKKSVEDDYKNFVDSNEEKLELSYSEKNSFQTSVRGLKVRGVFPNQPEAELRCKMLREIDPNHDVYVGPIGLWIPFHPEAYKTGNVQYLEKELNELMHEKKKNDDSAKLEFDKRLKESKVKAIQENIEKASITKNKLSQTINEKGELVSIQNMNTQEKNLGVNATLDEIKKELFEGDNIVVGKSDHGLGELLKKMD